MNDKSIIDLLYRAKENRVDVFLKDGLLQLKLPKDKAFVKNLLEEIKANKEAILEFLKANERANTPTQKIPRFNRQAITRIPLSFSQERLWFIDQLEGSVPYHIPTVLRVRGNLNVEALTLALETIINRHEVLRTLILDHHGEGYQHIPEEINFTLQVTDKAAQSNDVKRLDEYIQEIINAPFDLSKDVMLRANLVRLGLSEYILAITMHHIASDGWSSSILVREITELYNSFVEKRDNTLPLLPIQYADYAVWQKNSFAGEVIDHELKYWKSKLGGVPPLQLINDKPRPIVKSNHGDFLQFSLDKETLASMHKLCQQHNATLFMALLSAFKILLFKYSNQRDICVGTVVANRSRKEGEGLIGFFVNTLAIRNTINEDETFIDLLQQIKLTTLDAFSHQEVPFEKVVDTVVTERDLNKNPLFQVMFVLQNTPEAQELGFKDISITSEASFNDTSKFDLTFNLTETTSGINGLIQYSTDIFSVSTIERLKGHFVELISSILKEPTQKIANLQLLTQPEKQTLLFEFNHPIVAYPRAQTIIDLFKEQVQKVPGNVAVVLDGKQLTYKELDVRSNQLAHHLVNLGVTAETLVPICITRSFEMIIGILGILKSGGAYVPIDPDYPEERINYILDDISANLIITSGESIEKLSFITNLTLVNISDTERLLNGMPVSDSQVSIHPNNLAYVIYTSGSTGRPKGVLIEHYNVVRLFKTDTPLFDFNDKDVWTLFHSFSFDFSVWEIFGALLFGGKLVIVPKEATKDVALFSELIAKEKVTILNQTPSAFYVLQDQVIDTIPDTSIRYVIFGGEALSPAKLEPWKRKYSNCQLINMYGITETTVHVTYQPIEWNHIKDGNSVIGKPIPTLGCYILDPSKNLVPIGVAGELYISGAGVARGYLNRPEISAEKFINDPFDTKVGARLYRTGDVGRWLADGSIEYLGRIDDQVKIRGYRIELGEIESVLQQSGMVQQSVVIAKEEADGNKKLVGYVVPKDTFDKDELSTYLYQKLPEYMVPAIWVEMETFPLTANGKIDKKALPEPNLNDQLTNEYVAPRNNTELEFAGVWQELLHVEKVGIHDNFFELGGDSIITIQVVSRLKQLGYALKPKDLFIHQTIAGLSTVLLTAQVSESETEEEDNLSGSGGLLPVQQWFFETNHVEVSHFNQSILLTIDKTLSQEVINEVIELLVSQHDALRCRYYQEDGEWEKENSSAVTALISEDLQSHSQEGLGNLINSISDTYQRTLNIEKGELVKAVWIQTPSTERANRLLIIIHHLAVDGVSWRILLEEMELLLRQLKNEELIQLLPKTASYNRWYKMLQKYGQDSRLQSQINYWLQTVKSYQPFTTDYENAQRPTVKQIGMFSVSLDFGLTQALIKDVPRVYHTEVNDLLLSSLAETLCNWTGNKEVVICLEGHGREAIDDSIDISRTVGWFTTLYPLLLKVAENSSEASIIKSVKEQLRQVPDKGIGYGVLKYINKESSLIGEEPWDIQFNYFGQLDNVVKESKWLAVASEPTGAGRNEDQQVNEKITVNSHIGAGQLVLMWRYSTLHFKAKTIKDLAANYLSNLQVLIKHCIEQSKSGAVFTPSDYGLGSAVSYEELDAFLEEDTSDNIMSF